MAYRRRQGSHRGSRRGCGACHPDGAVEKPLAELAGAAANPLNIALDIQTVTDLKAAWPDVKAFLSTLGVKF